MGNCLSSLTNLKPALHNLKNAENLTVCLSMQTVVFQHFFVNFDCIAAFLARYLSGWIDRLSGFVAQGEGTVLELIFNLR